MAPITASQQLLLRRLRAGRPSAPPRRVLCRHCAQECECAGWAFCATCRTQVSAETKLLFKDFAGGWEIFTNRVGNQEWRRQS